MKNSNWKQLALWTRYSIAVPTGKYLFRQYAKTMGNSLGLVYVGGYPKSGTTWISKMVAYYLGLPWVDHTNFAFGFPAVVHHHWKYHSKFDRSIFVIRDGRDVIVSTYMSVIKAYISTEQFFAELSSVAPAVLLRKSAGRHATLRKRLHYLYGSNFDPHDVVYNLPKFIEAQMKKPFIPEVKVCWPKYISNWKNNSRETIYVRYEDMLADTERELKRVVAALSGQEPLDEDINYIADRFSFKRMTGRKPGNENRNAFARKGVAGDWKNYFSNEAGQIFDQLAGDSLLDLGYEIDRDWIESSDNQVLPR